MCNGERVENEASELGPFVKVGVAKEMERRSIIRPIEHICLKLARSFRRLLEIMVVFKTLVTPRNAVFPEKGLSQLSRILLLLFF